MKLKRVNISPPKSKLLSDTKPYSKQADVLFRSKMLLSARRHLQMILESGKLYGPMTEAQQIEAVEFAYGVKANLIRKPIIIGSRDND